MFVFGGAELILKKKNLGGVCSDERVNFSQIRQIIDLRLTIYIIQGRYIPDLYDLYDVALCGRVVAV